MRRLILLSALGLLSCDGASDTDPSRDTTDTDTDTDTDTGTDCDWVYFRDADEDGYGDPLVEGSGECEIPDGWVGNDGDCNDADDTVNPDATEVCGDGVDNDCDGGAPACRIEGSLELSTVSSSIVDTQTGEAFGAAVALVPDVDGDGRADLLVGRPGDDNYRPGNGWAGLYTGVGRDLAGQRPVATFRRFKENEGLGAVVLGGNFAGTDATDLVLSAPRAERGTTADVGAVHIIVDVAAGSEVNLGSTPGLVWLGSDGKDQAGRTVVAPGDVDGDGVQDLAIGAPQPNGGKPGRVYLVSGEEGGDLNDDATLEIIGTSTVYRTGDVLAAVGDVDGDGRGDLVIGGSAVADASTRLWLFTGLGTGTVRTEDADRSVDGGTMVTLQQGVVSAAGDVDEDGYDDVFVGTPELAATGDQLGGVRFFRGSAINAGWDLSAPDGTLLGSEVRQHVGGTVLGGHDLDHDGVPDLVTMDDSRQIHIVYGELSGTRDAADAVLAGSDEERRLGVAMASGGDLDGDGYNDLVLGAPGYLGDDGRVVLVWGTEGL